MEASKPPRNHTFNWKGVLLLVFCFIYFPALAMFSDNIVVVIPLFFVPLLLLGLWSMLWLRRHPKVRWFPQLKKKHPTTNDKPKEPLGEKLSEGAKGAGACLLFAAVTFIIGVIIVAIVLWAFRTVF